ncbi:uncharacterized protein LOC127838182 isoform X1 [Dreissena polymorpha]|uniref:uncharacterized protein LOC127838182 isoform X1 n=1 Tax=Dreissena polymorpha TaxID=45954 RepID=UPI0022656478|nr:uncharacterized protein LOC127838182 isoform X1 [Dreissena polymorpha]
MGKIEAQESEDVKTQKQNMEIIRRILERFNFEESKRKYETQNVVEYTLDPNDFAYDCSLSTTRVRQRLCDLMGTDVIRLNDKRYFQKLSERLQDEYETIMDKQEEARAASEEQRIRRLMLEGVIDAPNDYRAVVHGTHHKPQTKKKLKSGKRHSSARSHREATGSAGSDEEGQMKTKKEEVETQVGLMSGSRPGSHKSSLRMRASNENARTPSRRVFIDEKENDRAQQQQQQQTSNEMHARPPHHENVLRSPSACGTHRKERRVQSAAPRLTRRENGRTSPGESESDGEGNDGIRSGDRPFDTQSLPDRNAHRMYSKYSVYEPERVSRLREAETVEGLYAIAEEIVSPVRARDDTDRKVVRVPKQKKMTTSLS